MTGPKLIRDRVPEQAAGRGDILPTRVATPAEMPELLRAKLREEVSEYLESGDPAELVDVLEVLYTLADQINGWDAEDLEAARLVKMAERGGFARRLVWSGEVR